MISINDLNLNLNISTKEIRFNDIMITVQKYLPIEEKTQLIQYVVDSSLDDKTGCFSPLRVEVYFALGICKWYAGIEIDDFSQAGHYYDLLESNGVISSIMDTIPKDELNFIKDLINDTVSDITRYNNSAVGIIHAMNGDANNLNDQLQDIIQKISNEETFSNFKDYMEYNG